MVQQLSHFFCVTLGTEAVERLLLATTADGRKEAGPLEGLVNGPVDRGVGSSRSSTLPQHFEKGQGRFWLCSGHWVSDIFFFFFKP